MPRITAPTVAEHRAAQRAALVQAGQVILARDGLDAVSPRAVCEHAGLARSSFYDYFPSKDDLLVEIAIEAIEAWDAEIEAALAAADAGVARLRVLVDKTMAMTADGRHAIARALRDARLSPSRREELGALHDALVRPVVGVLEELGHPRPARAAMLVQGALGTGMQLVTHGVPHREVADEVFALLTRGLLS